MGHAGRPTKLTPEVQARIVQALRGGNFRLSAAAWAGVSARTMHDWMAKGLENPDSEHGEFRRAVIEAEKTAEIGAVSIIMKAALTDARHAEWWLTHRYPDKWSEKRNVTIQGGDRPIRLEQLGRLTVEELEKLAAEPAPLALEDGLDS